MKRIVIKLTYSIIGIIVIVLVVQFSIKLNSNGTGKYIPYKHNLLLNTTNGTVYQPVPGSIEEYKWEKVITFERELANQ